MPLFGLGGWNLGGTSTVFTAGAVAEGEIECQPLSDLLTDEEIRAARVVKIDVEGAEVSVVRGLRSILDRAPHDIEIIVEINGGEGPPTTDADALVADFASAGFYPYRISNSYDPATYVARPHGVAARRVHGPLGEHEMDLVFSRIDAPQI